MNYRIIKNITIVCTVQFTQGPHIKLIAQSIYQFTVEGWMLPTPPLCGSLLCGRQRGSVPTLPAPRAEQLAQSHPETW